MAATFRTRPWQLAPLARPSFAPALLHNTTPGIQAHMQQTRSVVIPKRRSLLTAPMRSSVQSHRKRERGQKTTSSLYNEMAAEQQYLPPLEAIEHAILAPRTIVPLPFRKTLTLPLATWLRYYKDIAKARIMDRFQIAQQTWRLKEKWHKLATFKASRRGVVEKALELHAEMSQALAEGGKEAEERLDRICIPKLSRSLLAAIQSRPKGQSYRWERVKLLGWPFTPRLVDHKWTDTDVGYMLSYRQAVVAIKSKQRLTELRDGEVVGTKEMELTEWVVLYAIMNKHDRTQGDWHFFGTLKPMGHKVLEKERKMLKNLNELMAKDGLDKSKDKVEA